MLLKHDFNFPTVCIVFQNFSICKRKIRAQKHFQGVTNPEFSLWISKQHNCLFKLIQWAFITMYKIFLTFHRYKMK